jgi:thioredoxin reductase (NADPH)
MRIVNPSFGQALATGEKINSGAVDWRRDPIVLFSNSKPNARELLEGLKNKFGGIRSVDNIDFIYKPSASQPASPEMIDKVAHKYRAALLALGD